MGASGPGAEIVRGAPGGDPARGPLRRASRRRESRGADVVIADTAGRLHTHANLMAGWRRCGGWPAKRLKGAPHESLLVIDATTGQNGLRQARCSRRPST